MSSTKAYEAFGVQPIIPQLTGHRRIDSICCWGDQLLVGCHDGTILQYAKRGGAAWQVVATHRSHDRTTAVLQLAAVRPAARPLLLVLTEAGVSMHALPDMLLKCQPMSSRGASAFAWSEEGQLLAVAVRRKVLLYRLRGSELLEAGERAAADTVLALAWAGPGRLVLGMRSQYVMLNTTTGASTDVAPTGTAPVPLVQLCPGGQELLVARDTSTHFHGAEDGRVSRRRHLTWSEPLQALSASGHYAVALTAGGVEVRSLRRAAESHVAQRVTLPEPPRPVAPALAEDGALFVAVGGTSDAGGAGARSKGGAAGGAAGGSGVYLLTPVSLEQQAHTLAALGEYGEALALAELLDDGDGDGGGGAAAAASVAAAPADSALAGSSAAAEHSAAASTAAAAAAGAPADVSGGAVEAAAGPREGSDPGTAAGTSRRALLEERLRLAYGHYLFQQGEFDEGMAQLALCKSTTFLVLLRLFPSLVPAKFRHHLPTAAAGQPLPDVAEPEGELYVTAVSQLLPYLLSHRTRAMAALTEAERGCAGADPAAGVHELAGAQGVSVASHDAQASAGGASADQPPSPSRQTHARESSNGHAPAASGGESAAVERPSVGFAVAGAPASSAHAPPPPWELLAVLDTALLRCLLLLPDSGSLLRFVQLPNHVDLVEGEQALLESGMYAELAALYKYNGRHEEGLELLRRLSQEPEALPRPARGAAADLPGLPGVWAAVRYLVSLSAQQAPVIQRHAGWILAADPEAGLSALLHMRPPLHPSLALSILNQHSRHYCGLYLETALQIGVALPQDYHNELLLIYLRDILAKEPPPPGPSAAAPPHGGEGLKELMLGECAARTDAPQLLFPEELGRALLQQQQHGAGGGGGGERARRGGSAPVSAAGTPAAVSRVPSQASMQGGGGAARGPRAASAGAAADRRARRGSASSEGTAAGAELSESSGTDSEAESKAPPAGKPPAPLQKAGDAPAAPTAAGRRAATPTSLPRRPRRPRRSSTGGVDAAGAAAGKPPLPPASATGPSHSPASPAPLPDATAAAAEAAAAKAAGPSLYQRLRDLVYTSPYIDPAYVLAKLPAGELLEIRALMLERLGCHREALRLYVHALRDLPGAEAYCDRIYAAATGGGGGSAGGGVAGGEGAGSAAPPPLARTLSPGLPSELQQPGDVYLELVRALYDGPESCPCAAAVAAAAAGGHGAALAAADCDAVACTWRAGRESNSAGDARLDSATWQALSRLLSRKRERLDPMQVLALLPDGVALADVLPLLEGSLRHRLEARRNLAVLRQLRRAEQLGALEEAVCMRQHRVLVTPDRACSLCHKRIGGVVFVSYPGGLLAHYLCHKRHTGSGMEEGGGREAEPAAGGVVAAWAGSGPVVVEP